MNAQVKLKLGRDEEELLLAAHSFWEVDGLGEGVSAIGQHRATHGRPARKSTRFTLMFKVISADGKPREAWANATAEQHAAQLHTLRACAPDWDGTTAPPQPADTPMAGASPPSSSAGGGSAADAPMAGASPPSSSSGGGNAQDGTGGAASVTAPPPIAATSSEQQPSPLSGAFAAGTASQPQLEPELPVSAMSWVLIQWAALGYKGLYELLKKHTGGRPSAVISARSAELLQLCVLLAKEVEARRKEEEQHPRRALSEKEREAARLLAWLGIGEQPLAWVAQHTGLTQDAALAAYVADGASELQEAESRLAQQQEALRDSLSTDELFYALWRGQTRANQQGGGGSSGDPWRDALAAVHNLGGLTAVARFARASDEELEALLRELERLMGGDKATMTRWFKFADGGEEDGGDDDDEGTESSAASSSAGFQGPTTTLTRQEALVEVRNMLETSKVFEDVRQGVRRLQDEMDEAQSAEAQQRLLIQQLVLCARVATLKSNGGVETTARRKCAVLMAHALLNSSKGGESLRGERALWVRTLALEEGPPLLGKDGPPYAAPRRAAWRSHAFRCRHRHLPLHVDHPPAQQRRHLLRAGRRDGGAGAPPGRARGLRAERGARQARL